MKDLIITIVAMVSVAIISLGIYSMVNPSIKEISPETVQENIEPTIREKFADRGWMVQKLEVNKKNPAIYKGLVSIKGGAFDREKIVEIKIWIEEGHLKFETEKFTQW